MPTDAPRKPIIDPIYLPYTATELLPHFVGQAERHVEYFQESARRYHDFNREVPDGRGVTISDCKGPCQIEKDERFWTTASLKHLVDADASRTALTAILTTAFATSPPIEGLATWADCLRGRLSLVFEAVHPVPVSYTTWLASHVRERHCIPYVLRASELPNRRALEGSTHVDAVIVNEDNGFALLIEAKVLSDISHSVSFDMFRNQLARNIDVMLEFPASLPPPLGARRPDRSLLALLSPECFRERWHSRLYGRTLREYRGSPESLRRDLPHRSGVNWANISQRLGWITFEDIAAHVPGACPWLRNIR